MNSTATPHGSIADGGVWKGATLDTRVSCDLGFMEELWSGQLLQNTSQKFAQSSLESFWPRVCHFLQASFVLQYPKLIFL